MSTALTKRRADSGCGNSRDIRAVDVAGLPWAEIDFPYDLDRARKEVLPTIQRDRGRLRRRPDRLLADRAYDAEKKIRQPLRARHIKPLVAKRNTEHGSGIGKYRWVVEAAFAWLFQYRRLRVRYEKRDDIHEAFLIIGCLLICWNRVQKLC